MLCERKVPLMISKFIVNIVIKTEINSYRWSDHEVAIGEAKLSFDHNSETDLRV